jgi:hypothetical protein
MRTSTTQGRVGLKVFLSLLIHGKRSLWNWGGLIRLLYPEQNANEKYIFTNSTLPSIGEKRSVLPESRLRLNLHPLTHPPYMYSFAHGFLSLTHPKHPFSSAFEHSMFMSRIPVEPVNESARFGLERRRGL